MKKNFQPGDFVLFTMLNLSMEVVEKDPNYPGCWICLWVDTSGEVQRSSIDAKFLKFIGNSLSTTSSK